MDLSIIIANFNTKELLKKCLSSIFKHLEGISFEVIVVDNASSDGSREMINDQWLMANGEKRRKSSIIKLIANNRNLGFSQANNQGAKIARGKYIFFLNSDAYLIDNSLIKIVEFFKETPKVGVLGPQILNPDKTIQQSVGFFPHLPQIFWWMSFLDDLPFGDILKPYHVDHDRFYKKEEKVDWVTGAALFVSKDVFDEVGGFDSKIFMYGEDFELCYRIKKEGFKIMLLPSARVVHMGRGSVGKSSIGAITGEYKGVLYFYDKYRGKLAKEMARVLLKFGAAIRILIFGIIQGRKELKEAYVKAFSLV